MPQVIYLKIDMYSPHLSKLVKYGFTHFIILLCFVRVNKINFKLAVVEFNKTADRVKGTK